MALEAIDGSFDSDYFESAQLLENKRGGGKIRQIDQAELSAVDYKTQAFLTVFLGYIGLDDFYAGNYSRGLTKLVGMCFVIPAMIIGPMQNVRLIELSKGKSVDGEGKLIRQVVQLKKEEISPYDQQIVLIFSMLLGWTGAHQFYTGKPLEGVMMLCSFGGLGIWNMINLYQLATCGFKDGQGKTVCPDYIKLMYNIRP